MENLHALLAPLAPAHRAALQWFADRADTEQPWPSPLPDGTLLATRAKGIYKPKGAEHALSVRQMLGSQYPDQGPIVRDDGTWAYGYYQENHDPTARDNKFTNRALLACVRDRVPIGVLRQTQTRPNIRYLVLGVALVSHWDGGYFFLEGFSPEGMARSPSLAAELDVLTWAAPTVPPPSPPFDPTGQVDARQRTLRSIIQRRGQATFRAQLLEAYGGRCAVTECDAEPALEAAHIVPYRGAATNHISNGLLLRADIHTLFDLGLLAIDPTTMGVLIAPSLSTTAYAALAGKSLGLPSATGARPSVEALQQHRVWAGL